MKLNKSLLKGSLILLISFNLYNALNFLFHFVMARQLTISDYGILATLFSIVYVLGIFTESIQTIITKYSAKEEKLGKLKNILNKSFNKSFKISLSFFAFYLLISIPLSYFLKISYPLLSFNGLVIFTSFLLPISRGFLQGRKQFTALGFNLVVESSIKILLGLGFVLLGWGVYGAIGGNVAGVFVALALSFISLKDITLSKEENSKTPGIYGYSTPAFFMIATIIGFYSIDIVIAKIFFTEDVAGAYSMASILAKTIFWGTQPISKAMFPISASEKKRNKKQDENLFMNAFALLSIGIVTALTLFYFFPSLIVLIFSGKIVPIAAQILFLTGIALSLLSISNLVLLHKLSLGQTAGYYYLPIFILIEVILLSTFSSNLIEFSIAFITASAAMLWASIVLIKEN